MPTELTTLLHSALQAEREGRLQQAELLAKRALLLESENPEANFLLGKFAAQTGRLETAIDHLQRVLAKHPDRFEAMIWLAPLLRRRGDLEGAISLSRQAVELDNGDSASHGLLGSCLSAAGQMDEALAHLTRAIELEPEAAVLHHQLAQALDSCGRLEQAVESYQRAIKLAPNVVESIVALAQLLAPHESAAAADLFRRAHKLEPKTARGQLNLGRAELESKNPALAEAALKRAVALDPNSYAALLLSATALRQMGKFDEAQRALERAIALQPRRHQAFCDLIYCRKTRESDRHRLAAMAQSTADPKLRSTDRRHLEFALGKAYDDLGEYGTAIAHFDEGNRLALSGALGVFTPTKPALWDLDREALDNLSQSGSHRDSAIFIVGMLRSGTTLLEQMLTCHPEVAGAGELTFWGRAIDADPSDRRHLLVPGTLKGLGEEYEAILRTKTPAARLIVDKMPSNYARLGAIRAALPNSHIIHMRRNPVDTCLSIYTTPNRTDLPFAFDRARIVQAYQTYLSQMAHWRSVLPSEKFIEIDYEDLVQNPEPTMRRLLEFLGLPWNDQCLKPEQNESPVSTPSLWQVRQPLYNSSMNRWKNYEPWLGAFRELLNSSPD